MKNKIMMIIIPILCLLLAILGYLNVTNKESDSLKFKNEYESLNNLENYKNNQMKIDSNNPIKYSNYDEIIDIIKNKTGIIYLGFPECPWCRRSVSVLLDVSKDMKIDKIYYLNIKDERDSYEVQDGKLTYAKDDNGLEKKGTKGYFKLLKLLDEHLTDYVISYEDKLYEVGEKRIYAPTVVFVKDGKIIGLHVSTVASHTDASVPLTKEQYNELYEIYEDYILELDDSTCSSNSSC